MPWKGRKMGLCNTMAIANVINETSFNIDIGHIYSSLLIMEITVTYQKLSSTSIFLSDMDFVCSICGKTLSSKASLRQHEGRHTNTGKYYCQDCGTVCFSKSNYERHLKTHTKERNFICTKCNASFYSDKDLRRHQRREEKQFKYSCEHCFTQFEDRSKLLDHQGIHNGGARHLCPECGKRFRYRSNLSRHQETHRAKVKCSTCKMFSSQRSLERHMKLHVKWKCKVNWNPFYIHVDFFFSLSVILSIACNPTCKVCDLNHAGIFWCGERVKNNSVREDCQCSSTYVWKLRVQFYRGHESLCYIFASFCARCIHFFTFLNEDYLNFRNDV